LGEGDEQEKELERLLAQISSAVDIASFLKKTICQAFSGKKSRSKYVELLFEDFFANQ
jgi:hypothetical protein